MLFASTLLMHHAQSTYLYLEENVNYRNWLSSLPLSNLSCGLAMPLAGASSDSKESALIHEANLRNPEDEPLAKHRVTYPVDALSQL